MRAPTKQSVRAPISYRFVTDPLLIVGILSAFPACVGKPTSATGSALCVNKAALLQISNRTLENFWIDARTFSLAVSDREHYDSNR